MPVLPGQESLREQLEDVVFLAAALDCSTKSRAGEIPRSFKDGREMPRPLRSDRRPETSVQRQLGMCFHLGRDGQDSGEGGGALRENPLRSLRWELAKEKPMAATGVWYDTTYAACCFMGAM